MAAPWNGPGPPNQRPGLLGRGPGPRPPRSMMIGSLMDVGAGRGPPRMRFGSPRGGPRGAPGGGPRGPMPRGMRPRNDSPRPAGPRGIPPRAFAPRGPHPTGPRGPRPIKAEPTTPTVTTTIKEEHPDTPSTIHEEKSKEKPPTENVDAETNLQVKVEEERAVRVTLDEYNCDLHFNMDDSGLTGWTLHTGGFEFLWGGARGTHGVKKGKAVFECTILEALPVDVPETERNPHVVRVGWSVDGSDFQLGEDQLSYGYGGTGKSSVNSKFNDYGKPFSVGDVITCCVDLDAQPKAIFYLVNGEYMGVAFKIGPELGDKALFPHVTIKNMKFEVNFGGQWPKYPIAPRFSMLQNIPSAALIRGQEGPSSRQDAEIIMMVGLPASGKTFWAEKYCKDHPEKRYYMLGTNNIIDKMRISGLTRKRNYHGRWDVLIKQATGCLNTWFKIAEKRVRNYILDQTNVYFTARRRKMNNFRGYKRISCVIVNEEKVLAERAAKREREEGKLVPQEAVMEMKANFSLPEVGESFDEVRFIEEKPPKAFDLVRVFTEEGKDFKRGVKRPSDQPGAHAKVPRMDSQRSREDQPGGGPYQQRGPPNSHDSGRRYDDRERGRDFQRRDDNRRDDSRRRNEEPGRPPFGRQDDRGQRNREADHRDSHRDDRDRRPDHMDRRENQYDDRHPEREQRDRYQGSNDRRDGRDVQIKQEPLDDHRQPARQNQYQGSTSYGQQSADQNRFGSGQQRRDEVHNSGYQQTRNQEVPTRTGDRNQGYQSDRYQGANQGSDRNPPSAQGQYQMGQQQQSSYSDQRHTTQSSQRYPNQSAQQYGGQSSEPYSSQASQAHGGQSSKAYSNQSTQQYGSQSTQQYDSQSTQSYGSQSTQPYGGQSSGSQSYQNYGAQPTNQSSSGYGAGSYNNQSYTSQPSYSYGSSSSTQSYGSSSTPYTSQTSQGYGSQQQIKQEPNSSQASYSSQSAYNNQAPYSSHSTSYQATSTQGNEQGYGAPQGRPNQQAYSGSQSAPSQQAYSQQMYSNTQSASQQAAYSQPQYGAQQSAHGAQGSQTANQQQSYNTQASSNQYYGQQGYSNQASTSQAPASKQAYDNQSSYGAASAQQYGSQKPYGGY